MTTEIVDGRQRIAASEAYISGLLNASEKGATGEQQEKARQWNMKRMQAFHEAESKGVNGDAAVQTMERKEYKKFWGKDKPASGEDVEMDGQ